MNEHILCVYICDVCGGSISQTMHTLCFLFCFAVVVVEYRSFFFYFSAHHHHHNNHHYYYLAGAIWTLTDKEKMIQIFYFFTWSMFFKLMLLLLFEWTKKNKFKFSHFCCCCRRFDWTTTTLDIGLWSKIRRKNVFFLASLLSFCRRCCRKFHSQLMVVGQKVHLSGSNFFCWPKTPPR